MPKEIMRFIEETSELFKETNLRFVFSIDNYTASGNPKITLEINQHDESHAITKTSQATITWDEVKELLQ